MKRIFLLLLFCHVSSPVKHSLKFFFTATSGVPDLPEYAVVAMLDEMLVGYCDTNKKIVEAKQDWMREILKNNPQLLKVYAAQCLESGPNYFKATINTLKQRYNQSGGVHILQRMNGCEWDDESREINGFNQYAYDGEDFISFDLKTLTWIAPKPEAVTTKLRWDAEKARTKENEVYLTQIFPEWLKMFVAFGSKTLLRTDLPSVSLLQKTPSSPVSCHATGFYPDRAVMFWRKDGEELYEDVDHGEILPNHDGSFQMSVDLNVISITHEDWRKYECVFHFSDDKDLIVTKLDRAAIRTNWVKPSDTTALIIAAVVVLLLILVAASGFNLYKRKKAKRPASSPDDGSEASERLNPETERKQKDGFMQQK